MSFFYGSDFRYLSLSLTIFVESQVLSESRRSVFSLLWIRISNPKFEGQVWGEARLGEGEDSLSEIESEFSPNQWRNIRDKSNRNEYHFRGLSRSASPVSVLCRTSPLVYPINLKDYSNSLLFSVRFSVHWFDFTLGFGTKANARLLSDTFRPLFASKSNLFILLLSDSQLIKGIFVDAKPLICYWLGFDIIFQT